MSRMAHKSARRNRAVWDRPATGTRLLLWPQPIPVSLGNPLDPLRMSLIASAPSRPNSPQRHRAADARVLSRMISRSALLGVEADACGIAPRMISRFTLLGVEADACGIAPRMTSRVTDSFGVEADACGIAPRMTSRVPTLRAAARAAEGALATLHPHPVPIPFPVSVILPQGRPADRPGVEHSGSPSAC